MKIDKNIQISIIEALLPLPYEIEHITPATKTFLFAIYKDIYFLEKLSELRKKYSIPENGYSINDLFNCLECKSFLIKGIDKKKLAAIYHYTHFNDLKTDIEKKTCTRKLKEVLLTLSKSDIKKITDGFKKNKLNLKIVNKENSFFFQQRIMENDLRKIAEHYRPFSISTSDLFLLVKYNTFTNFNNLNDILIGDSLDILKENINSQPFFALACVNRMSKSQMKKWIDDNWKYIEDKIKLLPETPSFFSKNIELYEEIKMYRDENTPYDKISELIFDKYPENKIVSDADNLRKYYERYLQLLKKYKIVLN